MIKFILIILNNLKNKCELILQKKEIKKNYYKYYEEERKKNLSFKIEIEYLKKQLEEQKRLLAIEQLSNDNLIKIFNQNR